MFRSVPLFIISFFFLFTAHSRIRTELVPSWSCSQAVSKPVWPIPLLCVECRIPDDRQRNCPKHVEFYSKNKFEKLVHLVGFVTRIYHDARSPERKIHIHIVTHTKTVHFMVLKAVNTSRMYTRDTEMYRIILTFCWPCISVYLSKWSANLMHKSFVSQ